MQSHNSRLHQTIEEPFSHHPEGNASTKHESQLAQLGFSRTCQAEEWCSKHAKPQSEIIQARLHQTMPTLPYQVLVCTNMARNSLLGPDWTYLTSNSKLDEDFDSLQARITDTVEALSSYDEEIFKAHIDKPVSFWPSGETCIMPTVLFP
jgi:hypothetical protein